MRPHSGGQRRAALGGPGGPLRLHLLPGRLSPRPLGGRRPGPGAGRLYAAREPHLRRRDLCLRVRCARPGVACRLAGKAHGSRKPLCQARGAGPCLRGAHGGLAGLRPHGRGSREARALRGPLPAAVLLRRARHAHGVRRPGADLPACRGGDARMRRAHPRVHRRRHAPRQAQLRPVLGQLHRPGGALPRGRERAFHAQALRGRRRLAGPPRQGRRGVPRHDHAASAHPAQLRGHHGLLHLCGKRRRDPHRPVPACGGRA